MHTPKYYPVENIYPPSIKNFQFSIKPSVFHPPQLVSIIDLGNCGEPNLSMCTSNSIELITNYIAIRPKHEEFFLSIVDSYNSIISGVFFAKTMENLPGVYKKPTRRVRAKLFPLHFPLYFQRSTFFSF